MMRCEHVVEKKRLKLGVVDGRITRKTHLRQCRHQIKSVERKRIMGLTWHVFKCRFGHVTRFFVEP